MVSWPGGDLVFVDGLLDELLGQFGAFPWSNHPAGDVATEDVQDHVEVEVGPLGWAQQLGDIPAPQLVGGGGQQLGFVIRRVHELIPPFAGLAFLFEDAVHGARGAIVVTFVQQSGLYGRRRAVLKTLFM
jgi:hypothetical protein